ncbi:MAG: hypothetical protein KDK41_13530 [Leptospiraceae bacterium]|nr:hypothetical protein [Leptospiraceae bacterium]
MPEIELSQQKVFSGLTFLSAKPQLKRCKNSLVQLYSGASKETTKQIGSGVLIKLNEYHFLITCAHVLNQVKAETLLTFIKGRDESVQLNGESVCPPEIESEKYQNDLDLGFVILEEKVVNTLKPDCVFLEKSDIEINHGKPDKGFYISYGFPKKRTHQYGKDIRAKLYGFTASYINNVTGDWPDLNIKSHFLFGLKNKVSYVDKGKAKTPDPDGMSGGAVFYLQGNIAHPNQMRMTLIGFNMDYKLDSSEQRRVCRAIRIDYVLELIASEVQDLSLIDKNIQRKILK